MKKFITIIALAIAAIVNVHAVEVSDKLLDAIADAETKGQFNRNTCVGDKGKAVGRYQLWMIYVNDVNRFAKTSYTDADRKDPAKSREIVKRYLTHYGKRYERLTGKPCTDEVLARIHNGGPNGFKKDATLKYWNRVQSFM